MTNWLVEQTTKIEELTKRHFEKIDEFSRYKDFLRNEYFDNIIKKVDNIFLEKFDSSQSYLAVDSAFLRIGYLHADLFSAVAVAVSDRYVESKGIVETETIGFSEEDEYRNTRLLEGLAFSLEILLAGSLMKSYEYIFLDGSFYTYLIKLNSAFALIYNKNRTTSLTPLEQTITNFYDEVCHYFWQLLSKKRTIAIPKGFKTIDEELNFYIQKQNKEKPNKWKINVPINVYYFLDSILEKGEYIKINTPLELQRATNFAGNFDKKNEILDLINNKHVYYLKGCNGKIFKFESIYSESFNPEFFFIFTVDKQFLPIKIADGHAKNLLQVLLTKLPFTEEYR